MQQAACIAELRFIIGSLSRLERHVFMKMIRKMLLMSGRQLQSEFWRNMEMSNQFKPDQFLRHMGHMGHMGL